MFFHQLHAALGAIARRVFHDFGVHRAGVLMSVSAAFCGFSFFAGGHAERG